MRITVHLHTVYQKPTENGLLSRLEMELKGGSTLAGLVKSLGLEINPDDTLPVLNGKIAEPPTPLSDGDVVHIIPAISGGFISENTLIQPDNLSPVVSRSGEISAARRLP